MKYVARGTLNPERYVTAVNMGGVAVEYGPIENAMVFSKGDFFAQKIVDNNYVVLVPRHEPYAPTFAARGAAIGAITDDKHVKYGDSHGRAGDILTVLYPEGIDPSRYTSALTVTRIIDKLFRIATAAPGDAEDPWTDIAGYALLMAGKK